MRPLKSKRGVSPLIATVLLIAFAVALGAVVMNWGRQYIEETQEQISTRTEEQSMCTYDTSISLVKIGKKPCFDSDDYNFYAVIENGANDLSGYKVTIFANGGIYEKEVNKPIGAVQAEIVKVNATSGTTRIDKATIIPKIRIKGASKDTYCMNARLDIEDVNSYEDCN